jgi:hypothetical protein
MTSDSARNKANKRKGAAFEIDLEGYYRNAKIIVTRLVKRGKDDNGDLAVRGGPVTFVVECKNQKTMNLAGAVAEAKAEALRYEALHVHDPDAPELVIPVAAIKAPRKNVSQTYIVMEAEDHAALVLYLQAR